MEASELGAPPRTLPSSGSDALNDLIQLFHLLYGSAAVFFYNKLSFMTLQL